MTCAVLVHNVHAFHQASQVYLIKLFQRQFTMHSEVARSWYEIPSQIMMRGAAGWRCDWRDLGHVEGVGQHGSHGWPGTCPDSIYSFA